MAYASQTTVSSADSRAELEQILARYGATQFGYLSGEDTASVAFVKDRRTIRFTLAMPRRDERRFTHTEAKGLLRTPQDSEKLYEQAVRQKWRALTLVVKAKLEAVESGISEFEQEFFAHTVVNGKTVYEQMQQQVTEAIDSGDHFSLRLELES